MTSASFAVVVALGLLSASPERGTWLSYQGRFVSVKGNAADSEKRFTLQVVAADSNADQTTFWWTLGEQRFGGWGWSDHFGEMQIAPPGKTQSTGPALLYDRGEGKSVVSLLPPLGLTPSGALDKGQQWDHDRLQCTIVDSVGVANRDCWKIEMRNAFGLRRTVFVDKQHGFVVAYRERTFIGQGEEHELICELTKYETLPTIDAGRAITGFESLAKLRDQLRWQPRRAGYAWNDEELATLKKELPSLVDLAGSAPLKELFAAVEEDVKSQRGRAGAVAALKEKATGRELGSFKLTGTAGATLDHEALKGKVTVLHFWEYRDAPLEEPYGQVGYLDFLHRRLGKKGVQVFGVAVDADADDPASRRRVLTSANKLKSFMNLGFPVVADDAGLLKRLGDPRVAAGKLPLFVVVGKNGKVIEYRAGFYEVHRDRGLAELDELLTKALESAE